MAERGACGNIKGVYVLMKTEQPIVVIDCDACAQFSGQSSGLRARKSQFS